MKTSDFNYELPEELIAQLPIKDRSSSRLMLVDKKTGEIEVSSPRILIKAEEEISIDTPIINAPKSKLNVKSVKATSIITDTFNAVKSALIKGIDFLSHVHSGVQAGNDDTGGPK